MQRTLFTLAALLAVALPATASADHRSSEPPPAACERPVQEGFVTIDNPNQVALEILVDREFVGTVQPGRVARFGPFAEGEHKVVARYVCNRRTLRQRIFRDRIFVDARRPARVQLPYADLAIVELTNEWIEGMDIAVDGQVIDTVSARGKTAFIAPSYASLTLVTPGGARAMTARVSGRGLSTESLALVPPRRATVSISNPTGARLQLVDGNGRVLCDLAPRSTEQVMLKAGWAGLAVLIGGRTIDSTKLVASPFATNRWDIQPRVALHDDHDDGRGRRVSTADERHHHSGYSRTSSRRGRRSHWSARW